jgi:putative DNA primase/helicase
MSDRIDDMFEVGRLAALSWIEYEREREAVARKLGVRPHVLDKAVGDARRANPGNGHDPNGGIPGGLPVIRVGRGERHLAATAGAAALPAAGCEIYVRGTGLVRIALLPGKTANGEDLLVPGVLPVTPASLTRMLGGAALWEKINWKGEVQRIDPPKEVVEQIHDMAGEWPFAPLNGVITCPTLRLDGSLLAAPGYDPVTGLFLVGSLSLPVIPSAPSKDDAVAALARLRELLAEFPFVDDASVAVACSQLITPVVRAAVAPAVPLHLIRAPQSGTGKSYLADLASLIATGKPCAVIAADKNLEETEKRLVAAVMTGRPIINLDNCRNTLEGAILCQITERPLLELRRLGSHDMVPVTNTVSVFANGNNLTIAGDLVRRTVVGSLDADVENPETRTFATDPAAMIRNDRGGYVAACLVVVRAYLAAGEPERLPSLPSFGAWSDRVRSPLVWLGLPDPVTTMEGARAEDPVRETRLQVFAAWAAELGVSHGYQTAELVELVEQQTVLGFKVVSAKPQLHDALLAVASKRRSAPAQLDPVRLGQWLSRNANTIAGNFKLLVDRTDHQRPRWQVRPR